MILISENILLEYSKKITSQLIHKFQKEHPRLPEDEIVLYLNRFKEIQKSPKVKKKDIFKYSWEELENIVHLHHQKEGRIKTGGPKFDPKDIIYQDDTFTILKADSKRKCVKYGNGYNFCISLRDETNRYLEYRTREGHTMYFIFNKLLSSDYDQKEDSFVSPMHLLVLSVLNDRHGNTKYEIVDANDNMVDAFLDNSWRSSIYKINPKLLNLKHLFIQTNPTSYEMDKSRLEIKLNQQLAELEKQFSTISDHLFIYEYTRETYSFLLNVLNNPNNYLITKYESESYYEYMIQPKNNLLNPKKWIEDYLNFEGEFDNEKINKFKQKAHISIEKPVDKIHLEYYSKLKKVLDNYYKNLMFLNSTKK